METSRFAIAVVVAVIIQAPSAVRGQGGLPVHCLNEGRPGCRSDSDCVDSTSAFGANPQCGNVLCDVNSGTCTYNSWQTSGTCAESFVQCDGKDNLCTKGPTGLSFVGRCDGWNRKECVYYWCPKGEGMSSTTQATTTSVQTEAATTTVSVTTTTTEAPTTTTTKAASGGSCCATDNDCVNYPGASPLLTTCGSVKCNSATSKCQLDVWSDSPACRDTFFVWCGDSNGSSQEVKDARCTKGPTGDSGPVEGKCTLFGGNECSYTYCPGGETTPAATTTSASTTMTTSAATTTTTKAITTAPVSSTTPASITTTTQITTGLCCQNKYDCKADVGKPQLLDCGEAACVNNQCVFETQVDNKDYCNQAYLVYCSGNDGLCNAGPAGSVGKCDLSGGTLCSYKWCPGVTASGTTLPPVLPPVTGGNFWRPPQVQTWDWQLYNKVEYSRDVDVYDVDLFINTAQDISNIKTKGGTITDPTKYRKVICYFSAGSYENWRPDEARFPAEVKGNLYYGFPNESWLDIRRLDILGPIMGARLDMAKEKGCDAVEPDNMDVYDDTAHESSGFPLTFQDQIDYNVWLSEQAHNRGMACGLKNDIHQAEYLEPYFEFVVSEQCVEYGECKYYQKFIDAKKPIFLCEYELQPSQFCDEAASYKTMAIKKLGSLGTEYEACPPWWNRRERSLRGEKISDAAGGQGF